MRPLEPFLVLFLSFFFFFFCGTATECQEPQEIESVGPQAWRHTSAICAGQGWVEELLAGNVRSP